MNFQERHQQESPLLVCNVWDVASAQTAEKMNFQAIGTSSSALAAVLGFKDGEEMNFGDVEYMVSKICDRVSIPLTVDLEAGYSRDPMQIVEHVKRLAALGVVGINLEDSVVEAGRAMVPADAFARTLAMVAGALKEEGLKVFLNVRTDAFLLGLEEPVEETLRRAAVYEEAGANGLFVPCIEKPADIAAVVAGTALPVNVMCMPGLPDFASLQALGVKRISMGDFVFRRMRKSLKRELEKINSSQSFQSLFQ